MVWQWFWFRYELEKVVQRPSKGVVKWWKLQGVNTKGLRQISGFCATIWLNQRTIGLGPYKVKVRWGLECRPKVVEGLVAAAKEVV